MAFTFLTTRVSRVHALEPPLRLQAIPDRLEQRAAARGGSVGNLGCEQLSWLLSETLLTAEVL
jgi:hypothetical protein